MKWRYVNQSAKALLGDNPFEQMDFPVLVKENPVRQVFKCGKFFLKCDNRFFNGLKKEFRHALKIEKYGIPVVPHLAVSDTALVTLAVENTVELKYFLTENMPSDEMLKSFADFINLLKNSNLRHNDLHSGNVLYIPDENKFLLVDLCNAAIVPAIFKSPTRHYSHLVMEMRRNLSREKIYPLLKICYPQKNPEDIFEQLLQDETVQMLASWQKRKKQILSGYSKFIRKEGDFLFSAEASNNLDNTEKITGDSAKYMLMHHFLELNHIPHRKVKAISGNDIYLEQLEYSSSDANEALYQDFSQRLFICGINSVPDDWKCFCGQIIFDNLASAITQCDLLEYEEK